MLIAAVANLCIQALDCCVNCLLKILM
jgi:hypothetical protein